MMSKRWSLPLVVGMLLYMVIAADAGWIMVEKNGDKTLISDGKLKGTSQKTSWIFNGPKKEMIFTHDGQHIYWRGTVDDYCSGSGAMFEQMMQSMPEEQRKMIEQMMAKGSQSADHKVNVVKKGDGGTIAGLKTIRYNVMVDGELFEEVWLTTDASLLQAYKPLIPMLQKFDACLGTLGMGYAPEKSAEYQKLWEIGFQLKSVRYASGSPEIETDVVRMEKTEIPAQAFDVPAGYQQRSFAEMMQSQME